MAGYIQVLPFFQYPVEIDDAGEQAFLSHYGFHHPFSIGPCNAGTSVGKGIHCVFNDLLPVGRIVRKIL